MLNNIESMNYILSLLEDPAVYGYEDITETTTEEIEGETIEVETLVSSDLDQMKTDIEISAEDILYSEILDVATESVYEAIQAKDFADYTRNDKRFFFAECYFTAYMFLYKYALKNESELFKTQIDFSGRYQATEKSGKIYSANEYYKQAIKFIKDIDTESQVKPQGKAVSIRRY
jgi:esterase/lipase superfamily enzyme